MHMIVHVCMNNRVRRVLKKRKKIRKKGTTKKCRNHPPRHINLEKIQLYGLGKMVNCRMNTNSHKKSNKKLKKLMKIRPSKLYALTR